MTCIFHEYSNWFVSNYWTPQYIFGACLIFTWLDFFWNIYLNYRQYRVYVKTEKVPNELLGVLDEETLTKSRLYGIDRSLFTMISTTWSQLLSTAILWYGMIPYSWNVSAQVLERFGYLPPFEIVQSIVFIIITSVVLQILNLPWSLYSNFVVEERHGFNKYTLGFFLKDKAKKWVVLQSISMPICALAIYIIKIGGDYFFFYLWLFCSFVSIALLTIYPDFIAPCFDKYVPLPDSSIKTRIEQLASSLKFPLKQIFMIEGSKRSSHSNAFIFGMFNRKKIVLFDTLIDESVLDVTAIFPKKDDKKNDDKEKQEGCTEDEIIAVLGHELGHWKLNHILKNVILSEVNMLFVFVVFGFLYKNQTIYSAFGFQSELPILIGLLIIFEYIFQPYNEVYTFFLTCLSRRFEFQADHFAKTLNKATDLRSALIKLNKTNLTFPVFDWLYSACNHSHPPLIERIRALGKVN